MNLADLPQGPIQLPPDALPPVGDGQQQDDDGPAYPTVVLQARHNMARFENCVLLTRVGGFYELYFEHAEEYGPLLNLKVAQKKTNAGPVPMVVCPSPLPRPHLVPAFTRGYIHLYPQENPQKYRNVKQSEPPAGDLTMAVRRPDSPFSS